MGGDVLDVIDPFAEELLGGGSDGDVVAFDFDLRDAINPNRHAFAGVNFGRLDVDGQKFKGEEIDLFDHWNHLDARVDVGDAGVADSVAIVGYLFCNGEDNLFESDVFAPLAALVADAQNALAYELLEAVPGLDAVELDRLVRPIAGETEIAPFGDGLAAAMVRARVHRVELVEADLLDRVVLIDVKRDRVQRSIVPVRAAGNGNAQGVVAELVLEALDVIGLELARDEDEIEVSLHELDGAEASCVRRRDGERCFRMIGLESLEPFLDEHLQHVGRSALEATRQLFLARLECGKRRVEDRLENLRWRQLAAGSLALLRLLRCLGHVGGKSRKDPFHHRSGIDWLGKGTCGNG